MGRKNSEGALRQWRRELAIGLRTVLTFDDLWREACAEAQAADFAAATYLRPVIIKAPAEEKPSIAATPRAWERHAARNARSAS